MLDYRAVGLHMRDERSARAQEQCQRSASRTTWRVVVRLGVERHVSELWRSQKDGHMAVKGKSQDGCTTTIQR